MNGKDFGLELMTLFRKGNGYGNQQVGGNNSSNHFIDNSADRKILIRGFAEQISAVTFAEQYQNACLSAKYSKEASLKPIPT